MNIDSALFFWNRPVGSDFIEASAEASTLRWSPGVPWPREFTLTGVEGECVMKLDKDSITTTRDMQTYLGEFRGDFIKAIVFNDNDCNDPDEEAKTELWAMMIDEQQLDN